MTTDLVLANPTNPGFGDFLEFMRKVRDLFNLNTERGRASLHYDGDISGAWKAGLVANAELVVSLPNLLGPIGVAMLTVSEREELYYSVGHANRALSQKEGQNRNFMLSILGRIDGVPGNFLDRICERLESEEAPRVAKRQHVAALDALLSRRDIATSFAFVQAQMLLAEGVTLQVPRLFVSRELWERMLQAACELLGVGMKGSAETPGGFLYDLGFRPPAG